MAHRNGRFATGLLSSLLSAAMLVLAFHPYNQWYFAFIALVPMLVAEHLLLPVKWSGLAPAIGIGGWLFVFLGYMFGTNPTGRVIQVVVLVIIIIQVITTPGIRRFHLKTGYRYFIVYGLADWVGFEMVRSFIPPINTHAFMAQTMYTQPWMIVPISVFSIYGLSLVIILVNFVLARAVMSRMDGKWGLVPTINFSSLRLRRAVWITVAVLAIWAGTAVVIFSRESTSPPTLKVAAVQHNYPTPGHQAPPLEQLDRIKALSTQARSAAAQGARLIVMPELGLGFDPQQIHTEAFRNLASETGAYLFIGYGVDDLRGWRNEMVLLSPEGEFGEVYGKNHPTSPGEPRIISSGKYPVYQLPEGYSTGQALPVISTLICNDVHYTDVSRRLARNGARLIAVPTLEGPGIALEQVAQSVMRAAENRMAIVKSDVAYASAVIDPYGRILALRNGAPEGEAFALVEEVPLVDHHTVYSRTGDLIGWICLAGLLFFMFFRGMLSRPEEDKIPGK
ncbi:MAG: nitrilase-related carbon-nitrogen hydrolase [Bacteroidales bacterium]